MSLTPKEVLKMAADKDVTFVDFKFMDFPGSWQHFTVPLAELKEESFEEGFGFDGSSIRGWQAIHQSDMLVKPDPATAMIDPFAEIPTLSLVCNVVDPITHEKYTRDPRNVALKCEAYLKQSGIADIAYFGPELEFFILDDIRYDQSGHYSYYFLDSKEGRWNSGREENPNLGYKPNYKGGYFPVPPTDSLWNLRSEIAQTLMDCGIPVEAQHHEVATAGQAEIDMRFDQLTHIADKCLLFKYIVKNVCWQHGKTVTFMPKPLFGDNGSGMHVHVSLWKGEKNLFVGNQYAGLSESALYFIGGLLKHAGSLLAFCAPTTNSYKRLVPGFEAPVNLAYSQRNRSAAVRIPMYSPRETARRLEFRPPDPSANFYYAFSAMVMAGIDGMMNKIDPGDPLDKNIYDLPPEEAKQVEKVPGSLKEALIALENDHEFLLRGDVFTEDVIETWVDYKIVNEVTEIDSRPHPYEFALYYEV